MKHFAAATGWVEDEQKQLQATFLHCLGLPAPEPLLHRHVQAFLFSARVQAPKVKSLHCLPLKHMKYRLTII